MAVGDADRVLEIVARELAGRRRGRAKLLAARAFAYEVRGAWADALAAADDATATVERELPPQPRAFFAAKLAAVRVAALVATDQLDAARAIYDREIARLDIAHGGALVQRQRAELAGVARLAAARIALAGGDEARARELLQLVIDDIRAGAFQRAGAHHYAAEVADAAGATAAAAKHRAEVAKLAPTSWLARGS